MRAALTTVVLVLIGLILLFMVAEMPTFGEMGPAYNEVAHHYTQCAVDETGATNVISAIILDWRAYDTLGEATVLFAGIAAVLAILAAHGQRKKGR